MQKVFFFILMAVFVCTADQAFCAKQGKKTHKIAHRKHKRKKDHGLTEAIALVRHEIEALDQGTTKENIKRLKGWINRLEEIVISKMQRTEEHLERYRNKLNGQGALDLAEEIAKLEEQKNQASGQAAEDLAKEIAELEEQKNILNEEAKYLAENERFLEKMRSFESKIQAYQEALQALEDLKAQLNKYKKA
jgi:hypothetical protein